MVKRKISRRRAVTSILALGGVTFGLVARVNGERSSNLPVDRIRPPGALREAEFLGACVRCGLCVQACPYDTLHLAELSPLLPTGTPYFTARDTPCHVRDHSMRRSLPNRGAAARHHQCCSNGTGGTQHARALP